MIESIITMPASLADLAAFLSAFLSSFLSAFLSAPPLIIPLLYAVWYALTHHYHTECKHVPWRRAWLNSALWVDNFVWETLFGMRRRLHFSLLPKCNRANDLEALARYKTDLKSSTGTMWSACPHHLLLPSFLFAFQAEKEGVHRAMGVDLDQVFTAAATVLFYIPLLRDVVITLGGRRASPVVLERMNIFALAPGGVHEMIRQGGGVDRVFLRTGFLRFAVRKRLDVNVIYLFDENECYRPVDGLPACVVALQRWVHRRVGAGFSIWTGRWGVPFSLIPYPVEYVTGVGRPILIKQVEGMEEEAAIEVLMGLYIEEVKRLFEELQEETGRRRGVRLEIQKLQSRSDRDMLKKIT